MPGLIDEPVIVVAPIAPTFSVARQKVIFDIDPVTRRIEGSTEIEIAPASDDLKTISLHCRQANITRVRWRPKQTSLSDFSYTNAYDALDIPFVTTAHQHEQLKRRLPDSEKPTLELRKPANIAIVELPAYTEKLSSNKKADKQEKVFDIITIWIDFVVENARDGLQFVGWDLDDLRYPHFFTQTTGSTPLTSLCPCLDTIEAKYMWEISIKTPRTIGDAFLRHAKDERSTAYLKLQSMSESDKALDLNVMCSGDLTDEIVDTIDSTKKTSSFRLDAAIAARHVGFAVGPFEEINLAAFRESDEDDRLGRNAVPVHAFCLPGRSDEVKNTCLPLAKAMDYFAIQYTQYPFTSFKLCFIDDILVDHYDTASLSLCSNNLLFGKEIIDPLYETTRELVFALASQWSGIHLTAEQLNDLWVIIGIAYFMTDCFLRTIFGNNEYRYQQKAASQKVCNQDTGVPGIFYCGQHVSLDRFYYNFIALKAPVVLFILDRRLLKLNATHGLVRMISRAMREDIGGRLSTNQFLKLCEKAGHCKLESFFQQWIYGGGCPNFSVFQRFNKKKLVVEMSIEQKQGDTKLTAPIAATDFMREVKEHSRDVFAEVQACFVGPMTIRIHEADGTPYEHIVEIKEPRMRFEIPYNTKYKRLKRSRRQREKVVAGAIEDPAADGVDDVLLYCLGDNLTTEEDKEEWQLQDWTAEDNEKMNQESYEWIRMDADFEWICSMTINMPGYMFVSQLQQDRDVVAQLETVHYLAGHKVHPLISTFLIRTLMDERYFHGVRTAAAHALRAHSVGVDGGRGFHQLRKAFQQLFCLSDSNMTSPNDFSDRATYLVQIAIVTAISGIRDSSGRAPFVVRRLLYEILHFNDNGENEYSDCFYVTALIRGLAEAVASAPLRETEDLMSIDDGDDYDFLKSCWNEIERYQRRDGWIPSYHNLVSMAALYAKYCLDKADCIPKVRTEYIYLTQPGNHEDIRVASLGYLFDLGFGFSAPFLTYFFSIFVAENSPHTRARLMSILVKFVGAVAIGVYHDVSKTAVEENDPNNLVIEQDVTTNDRKTEIARKETVEGALDGLKRDLGSNQAFMVGIWGVVLSSRITVDEFADLLTLCSKLYDAQSSVMVTVKYPRWMVFDRFERIQPTSQGQKPKLLLTLKSGPIRTERKPARWQPYAPTKPAPIKRETSITLKAPENRPKATIKLTTKQNPSTMTPARTNSIVVPPSPAVSTPNSDSAAVSGGGGAGVGGGGGFKIKLKFGPKPSTNGVNGSTGG